MAKLTTSEVNFQFGAVRTDIGERRAPLATLTESVNTIELKEGEITRRQGFALADVELFEPSGFYNGPVTDVLPNGLFLDSNSYAFARDEDDFKGYFKGQVKPIMPAWKPLGNTQSWVCKPQSVLNGGDLWVFTIAALNTTSATGPALDRMQYTVIDPSTGVVKQAPTLVTLTSGVTCYTVVADANGVVWFLYAFNTGVIKALKFASLSAAPVVTTYQTVTAPVGINTLDSLRLASNQIIVGFSSFDQTGTPTVKYGVSLLDTATGLAKASPAPVITTNTALTGGYGVGHGINFVVGSDNGTTVRFTVVKGTAVAAAYDVIMGTVTQSTLATSLTTIGTFSDTAVNNTFGAVAGSYASGSDTIVFFQLTSASGLDDAAPIVRITWTGSSAQFLMGYQAWLASKPFQVNNAWYFLSGCDDLFLVSGSFGGLSTSRVYHLRDVAGGIVSQALNGEGCSAWFTSRSIFSVEPLDRNMSHVTAPFAISATRVGMVVLASSAAASLSTITGTVDQVPCLLQFDFAPTVHAAENIAGRSIVPGGVLQVVGERDAAFDLSPLVRPLKDAISNSSGAGATVSTNLIAYLYKFVDTDGNVYRSVPTRTTTFVFKDGGVGATSWTLQFAPQEYVRNGTAFVELYGSVNNGATLFLQRTVPASSQQVNASAVVRPQDWVAGEQIYTAGGALINDPPPPARLVGQFRDRVVLWGTNDGRGWVSKELRDGRGPEFNAALTFAWQDVAGDDGAMCEANWNAYILFRKNGVGALSGAGPDGNGNGAYIVQTVSRMHGCTNPKSVVQGPAGVYFRNDSDGRIYMTDGAQVVDVSKGMEAYTDYVPTCSVHDKARRLLRWYCSNAKILILDYGRPTPDQPYGQWRLWENPGGLLAAVGCFVDSATGVVTHYEASSPTLAYFLIQADVAGNDAGVDLFMRFKLAKLAPPGLLKEWMLDWVTLSATWLAGFATFTFRLTGDDGTVENRSVTFSSDVSGDVGFPAASFMRIRDVTLEIIETGVASGGGVRFDGVGLVVKYSGKPRLLNTDRWVP